jgi:hypothetical protein
MLEVTRVKKTRQIVYPMGKAGFNHTLCLFPFKKKTKKGMWGVTQSVRNDNLVTDREIM